MRPFFPFPMLPLICFIIWRLCSNCFSRRLTSWTVVPEPFAMRRLRGGVISIIQMLENLKAQRDKINQDIEEGYQIREKIQQQLNLLGEQLQKVTDDLEQKQTVLNIYDKILNESDSAYTKIVQSTQALYNMVKNEEKKFGYNNQ